MGAEQNVRSTAAHDHIRASENRYGLCLCDILTDNLGSTALHTFLSVHPQLQPSAPNNRTFEEVQFFGNNRNYANGVDW
jgi:hypothetical protein